VQSKPRFCAGPRKAEQILAGKKKTPGYSHTAGVFSRTHAHAQTRTTRALVAGASKALDTCDLERGPFLNLYKIAHNKSTVDKWDNFPEEIPSRGPRPVLLRRRESKKQEPAFSCALGAPTLSHAERAQLLFPNLFLSCRFDQRPCKPLAAFGQSCRTILSICDHREHAVAREVCDRDT
jgi:hypothetical protein